MSNWNTPYYVYADKEVELIGGPNDGETEAVMESTGFLKTAHERGLYRVNGEKAYWCGDEWPRWM